MQDSQNKVSCPRPFTEPVAALPACGIDACRAISEANVTAAEGGGRTERRTRTPGRARGLGSWTGRTWWMEQTCSVADELIMQPHSLGGDMLRVRDVMTLMESRRHFCMGHGLMTWHDGNGTCPPPFLAKSVPSVPSGFVFQLFRSDADTEIGDRKTQSQPYLPRHAGRVADWRWPVAPEHMSDELFLPRSFY